MVAVVDVSSDSLESRAIGELRFASWWEKDLKPL